MSAAGELLDYIVSKKTFAEPQEACRHAKVDYSSSMVDVVAFGLGCVLASTAGYIFEFSDVAQLRGNGVAGEVRSSCSAVE